MIIIEHMIFSFVMRVLETSASNFVITLIFNSFSYRTFGETKQIYVWFGYVCEWIKKQHFSWRDRRVIAIIRTHLSLYKNDYTWKFDNSSFNFYEEFFIIYNQYYLGVMMILFTYEKIISKKSMIKANVRKYNKCKYIKIQTIMISTVIDLMYFLICDLSDFFRGISAVYY